MQSALYRMRHLGFLYDADRFPRPDAMWFDPEYWPAAIAAGQGRGAAWFIDTQWGTAVLKQYRRGGWAARVSADRYWFNGWERVRAWHEWRVLAYLHQRGLPVPAPWCAGVFRAGGLYRCALISQRLSMMEALPGLDWKALNQPMLWRAIGYSIRQFSEAGVRHADLNLGNILMGSNGALAWIDFDRARLTPDRPASCEPQIRRLLRSYQAFVQSQLNWDHLLDHTTVARHLRHGCDA